MIGNIVAGTFSVPVAPVTSSYESIATTTLTGSQSTITFTESGSAWSAYKHLQFRVIGKSASASTYDLMWRYNGDTGSNFATHYMLGNGSGAFAGANYGVTFIRANNVVEANSNSIVGTTIIDILDFNSTTKYKTSRSLSGVDENGGGTVSLESGLWMNTNAITSVTFFPSSGGSFGANTSIALYGIKD